MSDGRNDWGLTNPRAVRRGKISDFFKIEEKRGTRSTGIVTKNNKHSNLRQKDKAHKRMQKTKKQIKLRDLGFTYTVNKKQERKRFQLGRLILP